MEQHSGKPKPGLDLPWKASSSTSGSIIRLPVVYAHETKLPAPLLVDAHERKQMTQTHLSKCQNVKM
jgi:hypothetical protein